MKKRFVFIVLGVFIALSSTLHAQNKNTKTEASIGGKKTGVITKSALITAAKIDVSTTTKTVASFEMTYKTAAGVVTLSSNSKNFTTEMKTAINGFSTPTKVTFQNIMVYENTTPDRKERIEPITISVE